MRTVRGRSVAAISPGDMAYADEFDEISLYAVIAVPQSAAADPYDNSVSAVTVRLGETYITHTLAHRGCNVVRCEL